MCHLYNGFDNRLVSLKTWGDMNREPTAKFVGQNSGGWKTPEMEEFVRNDLFNILTDCKKLIAHHFPLWFDKDIAIRIFLLRTHVLKNYWNN